VKRGEKNLFYEKGGRPKPRTAPAKPGKKKKRKPFEENSRGGAQKGRAKRGKRRQRGVCPEGGGVRLPRIAERQDGLRHVRGKKSKERKKVGVAMKKRNAPAGRGTRTGLRGGEEGGMERLTRGTLKKQGRKTLKRGLHRGCRRPSERPKKGQCLGRKR